MKLTTLLKVIDKETIITVDHGGILYFGKVKDIRTNTNIYMSDEKWNDNINSLTVKTVTRGECMNDIIIDCYWKPSYK